MKVKILESSGWYKKFVGSEFEVDEYDIDENNLRFKVNNQGWIYIFDCVITELPESFCVKRCDDRQKWKKYIKWLNKTYNKEYYDNVGSYYGCDGGGCWSFASPIGTEIHIDDMIKHIDYMESQLTVNMNKEFEAEFDLTTDEGRLLYAKKYYPIGTEYIPMDADGESYNGVYTSIYEAKFWYCRGNLSGIEIGDGLIYCNCNGKWAEIIKEETNMKTQKLSRKGLKEIHSIACPTWKNTLEQYGSRNPLEDYIELSQKEIDTMFLACTKDQLPIVSKYLKQNDGSVNLSEDRFVTDYITRRVGGEYEDKAFVLAGKFDWEIKTDSFGYICLIPTKKKFSAEKGWVL